MGKGEVQQDLGVLVHQSMKVSIQVQQTVKKANGMLAFITRGVEFRGKEVLLQLYRALVKPYLECAVLVSKFEEGHSCYSGSAV